MTSLSYFFVKIYYIFSNFSTIHSDPIFVTHPTSQYTGNVGNSVNITGCQLQSAIRMTNSSHSNQQQNRFYWLVNGFVQRTSDILSTVISTGHNVGYLLMKMSSATVNDQGFYQCAYLKPGKVEKLILSNKASVQFTGIQKESSLS